MLDCIPDGSRLHATAAEYSYRDSIIIALPARPLTTDAVIPAFFRAVPPWLDRLMWLRNALVAPLGLKTGPLKSGQLSPPFQAGDQIGLFRILSIDPHEAVLGEDDRHLNFRVSLLLLRDAQGQRLAISTLVATHNPLGRGYFALVKPIHRRIVPVMARNIARLLHAAEMAP